MDFLYYLFIYPLESFMGVVLSGAFRLTGSWGASLVLLSLAVNVCLVPFYHLAESWQEAERAVQSRMAAKLAEIKAVYKGRERYMMTRALYRLYGYTPLMSLRTSAGLLIQIPFFFAAFHLLNNSPQLAGIPFFFVADLGQPDGLLQLGAFSINILPFAMTGVNLVSAAVYTSRLGRRETIQLYGLAALFLVLLYTSSSALLIYWTCNNLVSVFKNLVYSRFIYTDAPHSRHQAGAQAREQTTPPAGERATAPGKQQEAQGGQNKATAREAKPAWPERLAMRVLPSRLEYVSGLLGMVLFVAAVLWAGSLGRESGITLTAVTASFLLLMLALALHSLLMRGTPEQSGPEDSFKAMARHLPLFFWIVAGVTALCVWNLTSFKKLGTWDGWWYYRCFALAIGFLAAWVLSKPPFSMFWARAALFCERNITPVTAKRPGTRPNDTVARGTGASGTALSEKKRGTSLFFSSLGLAAIIVFWYTPAGLYASDPVFFYEPLSKLMGGTVFRALAFLAVAAYIFSLSPIRLRPFLAAVAAWTGLGVFLYTFVAAGDYGTMDGFILQEPALLRSRWSGVVDAAVCFGVAALLWILFRKGYARALAGLCQGACLALFLLGGYELFIAPANDSYHEEDGGTGLYGKDLLPEYTDRLFGFSQNGTNTVIVMFDMFTGGHVERILEEEPELREQLEGFVWYPDTMSTGATTLLSIASILGGEAYSPQNINAMQGDDLRGKLHKGFAVLPENFVARNYDLAFADVDELLPSMFEQSCPSAKEVLLLGKSFVTAYTPYWREQMDLPSPLPESQSPFLASVGLFQAAPWVLRQHIYYDGSWLNTQTLIHNPSEGPIAMLRVLPEISNAGSRRSTIKYIASQVAHYPWRLDPVSCMPLETNSRTREPDGIIREHLDAERCALRQIARWVAWMKEAGVYDNTQIFLASDHDGDDNTLGPEFADMKTHRVPWKPHALLMVKQPGAFGPLRVDPALMSSADIVALICDRLGPCPDVPAFSTSPLRVRTHSAGLASIRRHQKDRFTVTTFQVNGTMFDRRNWREAPKQ